VNAHATISDPILAAMTAARQARQVFPTGHEIAYSRDSDERGRVLAVAKCECGATFKLLASCEVELEAQIEAHWQRFDHAEDRGQPVSAGDRAESDSPPRENESSNLSSLPQSQHDGKAAAKAPPSSEPACVPPDPQPPSPQEAHAGSPLLKPGDDGYLLQLAESLAWHDDEPEAPSIPPREELLKNGVLVGPAEYKRKTAEARIADKPVKIGPLFGDATPPSAEVAELET
jgi:hypothetical protein